MPVSSGRRWTWLRFRSVVALTVLLGVPACRKSERLPPRPEELEAFDAGPRVASPSSQDDASAADAPPAPPPQLSAPERPAPQRVVIRTSDGVELVGDWFPPAQPSGAPVVLLVHGANGRRLDWQPLVERILATPTARPGVLAIDLRGHGESRDAGGGRRLDARTLQEQPAGANSWIGVVTDVAAALGWLRSRPEVGSRLALVGIDVGAVAAARAAAETAGPPGQKADVVGLVALSPSEMHGVGWGTRTWPVLSSRGLRALAVAAEDGPAGPDRKSVV